MEQGGAQKVFITVKALACSTDTKAKLCFRFSHEVNESFARAYKNCFKSHRPIQNIFHTIGPIQCMVGARLLTQLRSDQTKPFVYKLK